MDYKYIEQLLERYWNCETSVEEEQILRIFFQQKELPAHLRRYRSLFTYQEEAAGMKLGDDFDKRVLAEIERPVVKARKLTLYSRFYASVQGCGYDAAAFHIRRSSETCDRRGRHFRYCICT